MNSKDHIDKNKLEEYIINYYFQGESPGESEKEMDCIKIEQHISECDECTQKAHVIFNELKDISNWTVYEDNQALLNLRVYDTLKALEAKTENAEIKFRLSRWLEDFKGLAGGTFRVLMDMYTNGKRKTTKMITEGVDKFNAKNSMMFNYSMELTPTRGGEKEIVVNYNKLESENTDISLKIYLNKKKRMLHVEFMADETKELPIGILLPSKATGNSRLKQPVYNEQQKKWEIIFEDIAEGEYYFMFEPGYMV